MDILPKFSVYIKSFHGSEQRHSVLRNCWVSRLFADPVRLESLTIGVNLAIFMVFRGQSL